MKAIILGFAAMIVITVGAYFVLKDMGFSQANVTAGPDVRLGE